MILNNWGLHNLTVTADKKELRLTPLNTRVGGFYEYSAKASVKL